MHVQIELQSGAFLYCRCDKQIKTRLYSMATVALDILHTFIMFHGTYLTTVFVDYFSLLLPGLLKARGFLSQGGLAFHAIPAPSSHCFFPWGLCGCIGSWATGQDKTDGHIPNYGGGMCDWRGVLWADEVQITWTLTQLWPRCGVHTSYAAVNKNALANILLHKEIQFLLLYNNQHHHKGMSWASKLWTLFFLAFKFLTCTLCLKFMWAIVVWTLNHENV